MANLPAGFTLDTQAPTDQAAQSPQALPAGFTIDAQQQPQRTPEQVEVERVARIEELPEVGTAGLLGGESSMKVAAITPSLVTATDPNEFANILKSNFPNVGIAYTPEGRIVARNNKTGVAVEVNKPGLSRLDVLQGLGIGAAFFPSGLAATTGGMVAKAAITSGVNEAVQALSGGEFNAEQVALDAATAGVLDKAFEVAKATGRSIKDVLRKDANIDPEKLLKTFESKGFKTSFAKPGAQPQQVGATLERATQAELTPEAIQRMRQAEDQGVQLTRAQAVQDIASSDAEQTLLRSASQEGVAAQKFAQQQQDQLKEAADKFVVKFGGSARLQEATGELAEVTARDKGELIQKALKDTEKLAGKEVSDLYDIAGSTAGDALPLDNASIVGKADELINKLNVTSDVEKTIDSALAKFGLLGDTAEQVTRNKFKVMDGSKPIEIIGDITPLTLNNANDFRKALNQAVGGDISGAAKSIIRELDKQTASVIEAGSESGRTQAFKTATAAAAEKKTTFSAKDIVQDLVGFKKGTRTPSIDPEQVITKIAKGDKSVTNLRKIKKILLTNPTDETKHAWNAIKSETVGDILSQAINKDTLEISGARLNSAMKKYKPEALVELLGNKNYQDLKNLQQVIGNATIPPPGTTNPSGTFTKLLNLSERLGNFAGMGKINIGSLTKETLAKGSESAGRKKVLDGMINTKIEQLTKSNPGLAKNRGALNKTARIMALLELREQQKDRK